MLFTYNPITHGMEQMHEFIAFIFVDVWCNAPANEYGLELFAPNSALYQIMDELFRRDSAGKLDASGASHFFYEGINEIHNEFKSLTDAEIAEYRNQFEQNNRVEELCRNDVGTTPIHYASLNSAKLELNDQIAKFFKGIYSSGFFDLKFVKDILGTTLSEYYREFVDQDHDNNNDMCPFCGIMPLDGEFDPTRDAFDHYLPKGTYPFNALNLRNLAPSCNKCNSGHKLAQDPLHNTKKQRRKAFYPFSTTPTGITVTVSFTSNDWTRCTQASVNVQVNSNTFPEETATWKELFGIEKRYAAKCCSKNGGVDWQNRVVSECFNYCLTPQAMLEAELASATNAPWVQCNFLKMAFLESFNRSGLI